jgi:hypothetical protein
MGQHDGCDQTRKFVPRAHAQLPRQTRLPLIRKDQDHVFELAEARCHSLPESVGDRYLRYYREEKVGRVPLLFPGIGYSVRRNTISHLVLERFEGVVILARARRRSHLA